MATKLDFIKKQDMLDAFQEIDQNGVPLDNQSNNYWINHNDKYYPFKYSVRIANRLSKDRNDDLEFQSNETYRKYIGSLGFTIEFRREGLDPSKRNFWITASYYGNVPDQQDMLVDFLQDEYWATDHDLNSIEGSKVAQKVKQIRLNDRIAIRKISKKTKTVSIAAVGTVTDLSEATTGQIGVIWDIHPKLYNGPTPTGQGSGNWWKTIFQMTREEDIYLIFGYSLTQRRIARIAWNDNGWVLPSGPEGKSDDTNTHEGKYGYGHEEWLFDTSKPIDGYCYGFLEPVAKQIKAYIGKTYRIGLFTLDRTTKKRYWAGEILSAEVIDETTAKEVTRIYEDRGWLDQMKQQIIDSGANASGFSGFRNLDLFNIKFKAKDVWPVDPYYEIPEAHPLNDASRYTFMIQNEKFDLKEVITDDGYTEENGFTFQPSIQKKGKTEKTKPVKKTVIRAPRAVENVYIHRAISDGLTQRLRKHYGYENVTPEHMAGYGMNKIDIVVRDKKDYIFYEIKSYLVLITAIREALGQLLEYCCWWEHKKAAKLIIVTQVKATKEVVAYMAHLRKQFNIQLYYQSYDLESGELSKEI